ncbi:MAG: hypothetical protein ACI8PB_000052 [Desulforhopalus sp.]|jgi:hypothetical protein
MDIGEAQKILDINDSMSIDSIRLAYRDLVQVWHPDRHAHNQRLADKGSEKLKEINKAYSVVQEHFKAINDKNSQQNQPNQQRSHSEYSDTQSKKNESFTLVKCVNCNTTNRIPAHKLYNPNTKCGKCKQHIYVKVEKPSDDIILCRVSSCDGVISPEGHCHKCGRTLFEGEKTEKEVNQSKNHDTTKKEESDDIQEGFMSLGMALFLLAIGWYISQNRSMLENMLENIFNRFF